MADDVAGEVRGRGDFPLTKQWFDTHEAAAYIGGRATTDGVRKLVQRGHLRPDAPAGTRGLRGHRFHRSTLDAFLFMKAAG